jgi:hypothetical protein
MENRSFTKYLVLPSDAHLLPSLLEQEGHVVDEIIGRHEARVVLPALEHQHRPPCDHTGGSGVLFSLDKLLLGFKKIIKCRGNSDGT